MPSSKEDSIVSGDPVEDELCPRCRHVGTVVYNGNYWCTRCPWIMAEGGRPKRIIISYLRQKMSEYLTRGDAKNAARMEFHLAEIGVVAADTKSTAKPLEKKNTVPQQPASAIKDTR
jgi:hypothetical protein